MKRWIGPVLIAMSGLTMLWWSWGRWPDVLIDFGTQLYTAWQLETGKALFTDIFYFKGPLSPYLNALWFRLFGVSLLTLVLCNLAIVTAMTALLYRLLSDISDQFSATLACLVFVAVFAFGQLVGIGNYNFICPYSHEVTHGVALALASIACFSGYCRSRTLGWVAGAGLTLGLVFLTEAPVFLAAGVALGTGFAFTIWLERPSFSRFCRVGGVLAGSVAIPPVMAFVLLCRVMPRSQAFLGTMGSWPWIARGEVFALPFHKMWMGTQDIGASLGIVLAWTARYALIFGPAAVCGLLLRKPGRLRTGISAMTALAAGGLVLSHLGTLRSGDMARPLPLVMMGFSAAWLAASVRFRNDAGTSVRCIVSLVMTVFAFALMWKMLLYARIYNYGFALAMPATLLFVVALVGWVPSSITRWGGYGGIVRAVGVLVILATVAANLGQVGALFSYKRVSVGTGADAFLADHRGLAVNEALKEIATRVGPHETLAVLPHGAMLNYLSRRVNPTPYPNLDPLLLGLSDEDRILASLAARPPDYIALVSLNVAEHGARAFGDDFGPRIYSWVQKTYHEIRLIGAPPFQGTGFGILLLERAGPPTGD